MTAIPLELTHRFAASGLTTIIMLVVVVVVFMFLIQRPMKKQQAAQRELQNSVQPGARVMLTSGLFGTVRHLGDKQAVVELAPGLEVTVVRQAISKVVGPDDEEFEYEDSTVEGQATEAPQPVSYPTDGAQTTGYAQPAAYTVPNSVPQAPQGSTSAPQGATQAPQSPENALQAQEDNLLSAEGTPQAPAASPASDIDSEFSSIVGDTSFDDVSFDDTGSGDAHTDSSHPSGDEGPGADPRTNQG